MDMQRINDHGKMGRTGENTHRKWIKLIDRLHMKIKLKILKH